MTYILDDIEYEVIIERKRNKNLYIRIKDDGKIYVSCNYLTTNLSVRKILKQNERALKKMIANYKLGMEKQNKFFYLGHEYGIIINDSINKVQVSDNTIYTKDLNMLNRWLKKEIIRVFDERYVYVFNNYKENITSPILKIRNMKTRWGVYNKKNHTITLNSKLIEYSYDKIDYLIIHELNI